MAGEIFSTAGSKVYIGTQLDSKTTDFVLGDFAGQSWISVGRLENIGAFGDEAQIITFEAIDVERTFKQKGTRNAGDMALVCAVVYDDPGQVALRAAETTSRNYAVKVEFNDAPVGGTPSERYFIGLVTSVREALDAANNIAKMNVTIAINSNVVRVNAAA